MNIWNEKKEKNITESLLIEWIAMTKSYYRKMFKPELDYFGGVSPPSPN